MEELIAETTAPKTDAEYEAEIDALLVRMRQMDEKGGRTRGRSSAMDEIMTTTPKTAAEYEAAVDALLAEMNRMDERSEQTWAEIEQLKVETNRIKERTAVLKADAQARLGELLARFG